MRKYWKLALFFWLIFVATAVASVLLIFMAKVTLKDCGCDEESGWCCITVESQVCPSDQCYCTHKQPYSLTTKDSWVTGVCRDHDVVSLGKKTMVAIGLACVSVVSVVVVIGLIAYECLKSNNTNSLISTRSASLNHLNNEASNFHTMFAINEERKKSSSAEPDFLQLTIRTDFNRHMTQNSSHTGARRRMENP